MLWLWTLSGSALITIFFLLVKIYLLRKSADEIRKAFKQRLYSDTNTLIDISSRDRKMRKLAAKINRSLRDLRLEHLRFQQGDQELKEAVTNISHDLRTPLTAICGYLDLLQQEENSENTTRYLSVIVKRTEDMKQLTEELFRYSVILSNSDEKHEIVDMGSVLEESLVSYYGAMQQREITPTVQMPKHRVKRLLSHFDISRVFANIIGNALKYSDGDFSVSMEENGKIVFSNTARELTPVMVGRLFDRFYTVETGRNATGLGLSIAKRLTEQMGGTISAEYQEGRLIICIIFSEDITGVN
ncbi:HAMP domain-containing sensor histidine kinase [Sporolactobacillus sp. Y61]|uniref:histidine kinase n=1 Tax=Sporolactobacillus sp. Y61 TaxID=3160863 RepID=A0AAU8IFM6_9BACL